MTNQLDELKVELSSLDTKAKTLRRKIELLEAKEDMKNIDSIEVSICSTNNTYTFLVKPEAHGAFTEYFFQNMVE